METVADVVIVGAGAAGLATAIFTRRLAPSARVMLLDGAARPGAKILVSGGGRCNVTNRSVSERDFNGGKPTIIRRVLRGFPVEETVRFFQQLGVPLHEEADGKLFPDSQRARDVLDALLAAIHASGATLSAGTRVQEVERTADGFHLNTSRGEIAARHVVLATGGQSLPKSGSDGAGFNMARALGHTIVPTTPSLAPLLLSGGPDALHTELTGVSHPAELAVWIGGTIRKRLTGSLLWTHFGISGPVALDASRHWLRGQLERGHARLTASFYPGKPFEKVDDECAEAARQRPHTSIATLLASRLPQSVAGALLRRIGVEHAIPLATLTRDSRRRVARAVTEWPLNVVGSRGYTYAEATAGGVALDEIDPATMGSRRCPGLFFAGEMLDVDGRIGGFNFQWAWASAAAAARGLAGAAHPVTRR